MNKTELLANIRSGRKQLEAALARLSEEQLLAPRLHGGWSIKDLIAHFGFWEGRIATLYGQLLRDEEPAADEPPLDELNAQAFERSRAKSLDEVRREERDAYTQLLNIAVNASEDALFNPQHFAWTQGKPFAEWIENNTYGHYEEHAEDWTK
ncbi:MAG TPA: ClbS/DfsB family four-helix bundle protein [Anaerolineae bacterium]|nr:ClbS/DfsB family four-helix bundle protein [Anaerolineae bacterium]